jgi:hypothetical protein
VFQIIGYLNFSLKSFSEKLRSQQWAQSTFEEPNSTFVFENLLVRAYSNNTVYGTLRGGGYPMWGKGGSNVTIFIGNFTGKG